MKSRLVLFNSGINYVTKRGFTVPDSLRGSKDLPVETFIFNQSKFFV